MGNNVDIREESEFLHKLVEHVVHLWRIDHHEDDSLLIRALPEDACEVGESLLLLVRAEEVDILSVPCQLRIEDGELNI